MKQFITVTNSQGVPFNVRLCRVGDSYGLKQCLINEYKEPMIEFYDARYMDGRFEELGQFVSRYLLSTFLQVENGVDLYSGVDAWTVNGDNVQDIKDWLVDSIL